MKKFGVFKQLFGALLLSLSIATVVANVPDPAKNATPYQEGFALFRSANMVDNDKLSSGVSFHSFRIPAVVTTSTGRILAFAEGRRWDNRDYGGVDLVYKRTKTTTSGGASISDWEDLQEVKGVGNETWGNPTAVVDGKTIYLFLSWNGANYSENGNDTLSDGIVTKKIDSSWEGRRHLYLSQSTDDGATWSEPKDMTLQLTPDGWSWDAVGPGHGIVTSSGDLVVPAQGRNIIGRGTPGSRSWTYQLLDGAGSEGTIAQTFDGSLYRNDRALTTGTYRIVARGDLCSFSSFAVDYSLPDPLCEGSTLVYNLAGDEGPGRLLFLNSASTDSRRDMRVRITYDPDAVTYDWGRMLSDAPVSNVGYEGGYSSMCKTPDFKIGALVETDWYQNQGTKDDNYAILWRRFNLSWILNGPNN